MSYMFYVPGELFQWKEKCQMGIM